ncbi:MAG: invasion associated locus B family protein, partial [Rhodospirillaceae bacterium]
MIASRIAQAAAAATLLVCAFTGVANAQSANLLGTFNNWAAYTLQESDGKVCYIASQPLKDEGDYTRRGEIHFIVTHRPYRGQANMVTVYAGYPYKVDAPVSVRIGNRQFNLYTKDETAWATNEADPQIVTAMKRGASAILTARSA